MTGVQAGAGAMARIDIAPALGALAGAYRRVGTPACRHVAALIESHTETPFHAESGATPVLSHLGRALAMPDAHPSVAALRPLAHALPWTEGDLPLPDAVQGIFAFATLIGRDSPLPDHRLYFGLYLQVPGTYYPSHWHRAEELYLVLSGTAEWQQGEGGPVARPPGSLLHHAPDEPHAMRTSDQPVLAAWAWIGDLTDGTYRIVD